MNQKELNKLDLTRRKRGSKQFVSRHNVGEKMTEYRVIDFDDATDEYTVVYTHEDQEDGLLFPLSLKTTEKLLTLLLQRPKKQYEK